MDMYSGQHRAAGMYPWGEERGGGSGEIVLLDWKKQELRSSFSMSHSPTVSDCLSLLGTTLHARQSLFSCYEKKVKYAKI